MWLVIVPKNVANFGLIYKGLFGLTISLKFLIKITCIYVLLGRKKYIQHWFDYIRRIKNVWLAKLNLVLISENWNI